jgi:hypothetical protein
LRKSAESPTRNFSATAIPPGNLYGNDATPCRPGRSGIHLHPA